MPCRACRTIVVVLVCAFARGANAAEHAAEDAPAQRDAERRAPTTPPDIAHAGFAFSGEYGVTNAGRAQLTRGLTARALILGTRHASLAVSVGVSDALADYLSGDHHIQEHSTTAIRSGLSVGWGAPFRPWRWGIAIDAGFESAITRRGSASVSPYGGFELRVGLCRCTVFRPFLAGTGRAVLDQFGEHVESATAGLGLAWAL